MAPSPTPSGRLDIADEFRHFAQVRATGYAPLYAQLAAAIATQPDIMALACLAQPGQSRPDLLLAVIHELLMRHPDQPAARYYPSLTARPEPGDPVPDVLAFTRTHRDEIAGAITVRLVQTNEVGRCAFLLPAIHLAGRLVGDHVPLALIEVGASAGLNLLLDSYGYRYHRRDSLLVSLPGRPVLRCALTGAVPQINQPPVISWRAGIDLNPLDVTNPDDRRWLRALVWPDHRARAARLAAALAVAESARQRPALHAGDATELLGQVAATVPTDTHLVIYHSAVLAHMTTTARAAFTQSVLACSAHRDVSWLQAEPRLDRDPRRLRLTRCRAGVVVAEHVLGSYQPHGEWLRWQQQPHQR